MADDPHGPSQIATAGVDPAEADAGVVLFHGQGARAQGMLDLADELQALQGLVADLVE